ncbi:cytochrome P450 [Novosphingobium sp.]|uniref:cytochrome P450 n=1 Tax=Novosphingobium sp. TaxID=1874826 RepID=UPI00261766C8|nr:cytochrome P450 [Novosphingobium sp.]
MGRHRIAGYRDCEAALRNRDLRQALYDAGKVVMEGVLLTLHGEEHAARRTVEVRVFRRNFFHYYEKEVFPRTLAETLAPYLAAGGGDLLKIGYRLTVNLTADFAGIDRPTRSAEETEHLIAITRKLGEGATLVHSTRDHAEVSAEVAAVQAQLRERFFLPSLARRRALLAERETGSITDAELPRDVLMTLLVGNDELGLSEDQLLREIAFYLQAGAHSTANAVVHALWEVLEWADEDEDRWARLDDPVFVQHCVHESLRLHPASPEAWRTAMCPMQLAGIGPVAAQDRVELDLFLANRDAAIFGENADRFEPERTLPATVLRSGLAFGIGLHTCLGRELDGGIAARPGTDTADAQLGIVTLILVELLRRGARTIPHDPPQRDTNTSRPNWGRFPVRFTAKGAS